MKRIFAVFSLLGGFLWSQSYLLVPMDSRQTDHLRAYGVAYHALELGLETEWLLNYRGGSFLIQASPEITAYAGVLGVTVEPLSASEVQQIYQVMDQANMNRVVLEKPPRVAVYIPPYAEPWDDAVSLALTYARIPFDRIYDREILNGKLADYDWLHLHHEDFTGQFGKFYASYRNAEWYRRQVETSTRLARELGFQKVWQLKHAVALKIREFVRGGGFLFAMCSAPITLDIALAAGPVDIVATPFDGDPPDSHAQEKLDFSQTLAFQNFRIYPDPLVYEHSDIDVTREAARRGPHTYFTLFDFSAKFDPVPTILTQNHTRVIREFLGQDTGFRKDRLKDNVVIMGEVLGTQEAKYIYGNYGKGFFSFLGGHDPEDYQHFIGDPPTDLSLHKHSPGYRLILNNVLFPAAQKQPLKT